MDARGAINGQKEGYLMLLGEYLRLCGGYWMKVDAARG